MGNLFKQALRLLILLSLVTTSFLNVSPAHAAPGDCDGTPADDLVTCSSDPTVPDANVGLGLGDDTYVQEAGVVSDTVDGDALEDGSPATGDGGDDHITINGTVNSCVSGDYVTDNGGNDTIIINGHVICEVAGDNAGNDGGNDTITVNGRVDSVVYGDIAGNSGGDDTIVINGEADEVVGDYIYSGSGGNDMIVINGDVEFDVSGDVADGDGGHDTIVINATVGGDVYGDSVNGDGGNDTIIINGTVSGDVVADDVGGNGGDDRVELGADADVAGSIYGEDGFDTLVFRFLAQSRLTGLDPAGDSLTYNGHTYTWFDFERLLGLLSESVQELQTRILYAANGLLAIETTDGLRVIYNDRLVAFIPYQTLSGETARRYQAANSDGWYVLVSSLGFLSDKADRETFQVQIFAPAGVQAGQFTFVH